MSSFCTGGDIQGAKRQRTTFGRKAIKIKVDQTCHLQDSNSKPQC